MTVGTKSILFGVHCFFIHPWFVAYSWWKLYKFRVVHCQSSGVSTCLLDPRLWICFIVHDLGYIGKPNMDGPEGEEHPYLGATIVSFLCDTIEGLWNTPITFRRSNWYHFCLYHSRFLASRDGHQPSILCWADKYAVYATPSWLYVPMARWTGELNEYMKINPREVKGYNKTPLEWHTACRNYCKRLALEHCDGRIDTWTKKENRQ